MQANHSLFCLIDHVIVRCVSGDCSHLSSTPLKSRTSHCPHPHTSSSSPLIFSAHLPTSSCHPTTSSLVLTPGVNLPQLSPIENDSRGTREGSKGKCESCKRLFSSLSPNPQVHTNKICDGKGWKILCFGIIIASTFFRENFQAGSSWSKKYV